MLETIDLQKRMFLLLRKKEKIVLWRIGMLRHWELLKFKIHTEYMYVIITNSNFSSVAIIIAGEYHCGGYLE